MTKFGLYKYAIMLFLTGFAALVYEITFLKTLSLFLGQSTYAFSVMLAAFMFGIGIGSLLASKFKGEPLWLFSLTQLGIAAYSIIYIPLLNNTSIPAFYIATLPFYIQNVGLILFSLVLLIIPTSLMGLSFPLLLRHVVDEKKDKKPIGQLFAFNTLGGLLGSLAAGFIFLPEFGVSGALIIAAVINLSVAVSIKTKSLLERTIAAVVLLAILILINPKIDVYSVGSFYNVKIYGDVDKYARWIDTKRNTSQLLFSDFDVYGSVFVLKTEKYKTLYINGKPDAGTAQDAITELMIGYIPMLLNANAKKVAVVGLGSGITVGATLQFDAEKVDVYEINPAVIEANKFFSKESHNALSNPKTKVIMGDARRNLALSGEIYDVIISEPSNPWIEGEGFLFTKEYYDIVDEHLSEQGVFVQWIGSYDYTEETFNILMNTLHIKFPYIQLWSDGTDFYIISSHEPKTFNYTKTLEEINKPAIKSDLELIGLLNQKQLNPIDIFFSYFVTHYKVTGETRINTDDNSIVEFNTGKHSGKAGNIIQELVKDQMKVFPAKLSKNNLDIIFDTDLPYFDSKYSFIQSGNKLVINKQIIFKDEENSLFVQTTTQSEEPTLEQAMQYAKTFNAVLTESKDYLYNLSGVKSNGVIGYCPEKQQSFLLFSTTKSPLIVRCK